MITPKPDDRSERRKVMDEQIAAEPHLPLPAIPPGQKPKRLEELLPPRKPLAVAGVVENGMIRLLDPLVHLPEQSHVIVVAASPR